MRNNLNDAKKLEEDKSKYLVIKICVIIVELTTLIHQIRASVNGSFQNSEILQFYWGLWLLIFVLIMYSHLRDKPHINRFLHHLLIIRMIIPLFNPGDRKLFQDLASAVNFTQSQNLGINIQLFLFCTTENFIVNIPISILYQFLICYGQCALFYQREATPNHLVYVIENKISFVILQTCIQLLGLYFLSVTVLCMINQKKLI